MENLDISKDAKVYDGVVFVGKCSVGAGTVIYPNTVVDNCVIGENCIVKSSFLEQSVIHNNVEIGPYAHIRPNSEIDDNCKIGNFVEIKNSHLGENTKASHLAYVGDAEIGKCCNIGCGAIFVNFNGREKHKTIVGDDCFIGSNCNIIAPVNIADKTYICAGTTLTKDTEKFDFVVGRVRETVKHNKAQKYLKTGNSDL